MIKLDSNESPFGPSVKAIGAMQAAVERGNRYPDNDAAELGSRLASMHGLAPDQLLVTAGLTDFLAILCRYALKAGLNAVTSQRSFIVYSIASKAAGGQLIETPMQNHGLDLDAISAAINPDTRLVFLANPNNPTGTAFEAADLDRFLARVPENVIVVIDEAYYDYAAHFAKTRGSEYSHSVDYVREHPNALVLRTFSKAHGLAGLRVAYAMGRPELLKALGRMRSTFSISTAAQAGALASLDDPDHLARAMQNNVAGANLLTRELSNMGYQVPQTWANFVYCEIGENARDFSKKMEAEGILIRALGSWGAPTAIRVTIGNEQDNQAFLSAIRRIRATREVLD